ncbi:type II secretion system F family protein [Vibrio fluvialis]|uniref:type II secretion system F family protein n=1 Tax=Vibrio fluvialis TaxID=676 RepID=UPI001F28D66C|nr:type II secretion system F family protein [Vibrio fluvialis]MCE7604197.1 type II secretion system F family protein [Vibrio fluvialis]
MAGAFYFFIASICMVCASLCFHYSRKYVGQTSITVGADKKAGSIKEHLLMHSQKWWGKSKQQHQKSLSQIVIAMRQAGYISSRQQILCLFKMFLVWSGLFLILTGQQYLFSTSFQRTFLYYALFMAIGALVSIRWIRMQAHKRARIIDEEMLTVVHMMAILWQVGLSLESLLKAYHKEARHLTPEMNKDIAIIIARIEAGQNREWVFRDMATMTLSSGLQDLLSMLSQGSETGGGLKTSFQSLAELIYERKRVALQEKVTKMSGKISVAMMTLMFPALFIVLGGPAALALLAAFGG